MRQPAPVGGSPLSGLSARSRKHEAKTSVSENPTTYSKKLYKKIRGIRQHPSPKIRVVIIQKQSHRSLLIPTCRMSSYGFEWIYLHTDLIARMLTDSTDFLFFFDDGDNFFGR